MQPPLDDNELAALYPCLIVAQRREMERWFRSRNEALMLGLPLPADPMPFQDCTPENPRDRFTCPMPLG
jgi:hypothetical protein